MLQCSILHIARQHFRCEQKAHGYVACMLMKPVAFVMHGHGYVLSCKTTGAYLSLAATELLSVVPG